MTYKSKTCRLTCSFEELYWGRKAALKEEAYERGKAFCTAETSHFWEDAEGFSDGEDGWWEEVEADAFLNGEEREAGNASVVSCNRITAI